VSGEADLTYAELPPRDTDSRTDPATWRLKQTSNAAWTTLKCTGGQVASTRHPSSHPHPTWGINESVEPGQQDPGPPATNLDTVTRHPGTRAVVQVADHADLPYPAFDLLCAVGGEALLAVERLSSGVGVSDP
jgi:hypothetical protein